MPDQTRHEGVIDNQFNQARTSHNRIREDQRADMCQPKKEGRKNIVRGIEQQRDVRTDQGNQSQQPADGTQLNDDADQGDGDQIGIGSGKGPAHEIIAG